MMSEFSLRGVRRGSLLSLRELRLDSTCPLQRQQRADALIESRFGPCLLWVNRVVFGRLAECLLIP
jgi:hypothetical protein